MSLDIPQHLLPQTSRQMFQTLRHHVVRPAIGVTPKHVVHPDYWVHLAARYEVDDMITVLPVDGIYEALLRIVEIDPRKLWLRVRVLRGWPAKMWESLVDDEPTVAFVEATDYRIEFGGAHKWRIINRTGDVVESHIPTKIIAETRVGELRAEKLRTVA